MSKTILTHQDHIAIQSELKGLNGKEAEHSVCVRLAARFGVGKGRIYELRHGIHTPPCCLQTGGVITKAMIMKATNLKPIAANLFNKTNPAGPVKKGPATGDLPLVGFRMWNYFRDNDGRPRLASYNSTFGGWVPGERFTAVCQRGSAQHEPAHVPSKIDCCGVHAYKEKTSADLLVRSSDGIMGAVIMYGTVREATEGYRAQFAKVLCFSIKPVEVVNDVMVQAKADRLYALRVKRTEALAKEYAVPIVPYEHIELYASEFGQLLPICKSGRY